MDYDKIEAKKMECLNSFMDAVNKQEEAKGEYCPPVPDLPPDPRYTGVLGLLREWNYNWGGGYPSIVPLGDLGSRSDQPAGNDTAPIDPWEYHMGTDGEL